MKVKKRQQRVLMILESKNIKYDVVDIAEPGNEDAKEFMQHNAKSFGATIGDANPRSPLPPQIFNDDDYCGDYDQFDLSNEIDEIEKFLKLPYTESEKSVVSNAELKLGNGEIITNSSKDEDATVTEDSNDNVNKVDAEEKTENESEAVAKDSVVQNDVADEKALETDDEKKELSPEKETVDKEEIKSEDEEELKEKLKNGSAEDGGLEDPVEA